jgi:MFS family permease
MWTWALIIGSLASMALADHMARVRGRSPRAWFWIAFLVGPLAPLELLALGQANRTAPAN